MSRYNGFFVLLGLNIILLGCNNGSNSSSPASGGNNSTMVNLITIDNSGVIPVFNDGNTNTVIYVHNNSNVTISDIMYTSQQNMQQTLQSTNTIQSKLLTNSVGTTASTIISLNSANTCARIEPGKSCALSITTPTLGTASQGSALINAFYSINNQNYNFSNVISYANIYDNPPKGAAFASGAQINSFGNNYGYATVYMYGSGQNTTYTVDSMAINKTTLNITQGNISGTQLQANIVQAVEISSPAVNSDISANLIASSSDGMDSYSNTSNLGVTPVGSGAILTTGLVPLINSNVANPGSTLYVTNSGNENTVIGNASYTGGVNASTDSCSNTTLVPGGSCSIIFTVPQASGSGNITLPYTGSSNDPASIAASVTWYNGNSSGLLQIYANPNAVVFYATESGYTTVTLTNLGGYNVESLTIATPVNAVGGSGTTTMSANTCTQTLAVGQSCSYNLTINDNNIEANQQFNLSYTGTYSNNTSFSQTIPLAYTANAIPSPAQNMLYLAQAAEYSCMLNQITSVAYCWGLNGEGELGNGTFSNTGTPTAVVTGGLSAIPSGTQLVAISAGSSAGGAGTSCAISATGNLYCWGDNRYGTIGNGTSGTHNQYAESVATGGSSAIPVGAVITGVSCANTTACAVDSNGNAYCWGDNTYGQFGNGTTGGRSSYPVLVAKGGSSAIPSGTKLTSISAGGYVSCALDSSGNAYCWGNNQSGALGNGTNTNSAYPVLVVKGGNSAIPSGTKINQISVSKDNDEPQTATCVVANNNNAYCWGYNGQGALGNGSTTNSSYPVQVLTGGSSAIPSGGAFSVISTADQQTCAVVNGIGYCWGLNSRGQLGNNSTTNSIYPVAVLVGRSPSAVPAGVTFQNIATGYDDGNTKAIATCALGSDSNFYCWGDNTYGELGIGTINNPPESTVPVKVLIP